MLVMIGMRVMGHGIFSGSIGVWQNGVVLKILVSGGEFF
jgi:hypothetical protein